MTGLLDRHGLGTAVVATEADAASGKQCECGAAGRGRRGTAVRRVGGLVASW